MMMKTLLEKLNYKGQPRIAMLKSDSGFLESLSADLKDVIIDKEIDPRCPYSFILIFVKSISEVEDATPDVLHNLTADGVLWFCYPKKSSKNFKSDINRDHGWNSLIDSGFYGIRMVSIDDDWSALRFRHTKFIKSRSKKVS
ncbi:MAG TPA: hypothetical protein VMV47_05240 [Bacteroidales bacterium]|nr:hypothetical protein [Bacteroidales bacterium]